MLGKLDSTNKKFTNYSIRKTTVCKLQKAGVYNDRIAAITGHRNEQSLRDYADADPDDHRTISSILSNPRPLHSNHSSEAEEAVAFYRYATIFACKKPL